MAAASNKQEEKLCESHANKHFMRTFVFSFNFIFKDFYVIQGAPYSFLKKIEVIKMNRSDQIVNIDIGICNYNLN